MVLIGGGIFFFNYNFGNKDEGISCEKDSDCGDNNLCTTDSCSLKTGICYNIKKKCSFGQSCNLSTGICETKLNTGVNFNDSYDLPLKNPISSCDKNNLNLCLNSVNCEEAGGFWYGNNCNEEEEVEETIDYSNIPPPPPLPS